VIIVAAGTIVVPPEPPPVDLTPDGFGLELIGTNGTVWNLNEGPVYACAGTGGIGPTDPTHWFTESPTVDGATWNGLRYANDDFELSLEVTKGTADLWVDTDRELWKGIHPEEQATLRLTLPDASSRRRLIRYKSGGDASLDENPFLFERRLYPLTFIADPFWIGQEIVEPYVVRTSSGFFTGPPFTIGPGNTTFNSTVTNPGDFAVWGKWVVYGPYTSATVGVGSAVVTLNTSIATGDYRVIDMNPEVRDITKPDGSSAWTECDPIKFRKIPRGDDVPITLAATGATTDTLFELSFTPLYRRAW
jgi:hypothetical protein